MSGGAQRQQRIGRVLLCVCGAYLSYSVPSFVLQLLRYVADDVQVVLSPSAAKMASIESIELASRHPVYVDMMDRGATVFVPHIELSRAADAIIVYPASVNTMAKVANGITDALIPLLINAAQIPVIFVPVANPAMNMHPATRRNIAQLQADGYIVLPPMESFEVATREGLEKTTGSFSLPPLLKHLAAALADWRGPGGGAGPD